MTQDDWNYLCLAFIMPFHGPLHLDVIAIIGGHEIGADQQQDDLRLFQMIVDLTLLLLAGADQTIMPGGDDAVTLQ